jgi:hypothetical protein
MFLMAIINHPEIEYRTGFLYPFDSEPAQVVQCDFCGKLANDHGKNTTDAMIRAKAIGCVLVPGTSAKEYGWEILPAGSVVTLIQE